MRERACAFGLEAALLVAARPDQPSLIFHDPVVSRIRNLGFRV